MSAVRTLVAALGDPASVAALDDSGWAALISVARAESLLGTLAERCAPLPTQPPHVANLFAAERAAAAQAQRHALWEAQMAHAALAPLGIVPVLLKGTAYAAAGLSAASGRQIGDLDILVSRSALPAVEASLLAAGWEWVKTDAYDQAYYRDHMHELPPMIHATRDRMIDVHHTILPLTHRATPDAAAMLARAVPVAGGPAGGCAVLDPLDRLVHCAAHLLADGDLAGGLRNLWDFHCLWAELGDGQDEALLARAADHQLRGAVVRALRLTAHVYRGNNAPLPIADQLFVRRLMARDGWGREARGATRLAFFVRSHALRMPPIMLARHLWVKWRRN